MNRSCRIVYSLGIALLMSGCVPLEYRTARFNKTWPGTQIRRVEVHQINGTISIAAGAADVVQMSAVVHARGLARKRGEENDGYFRTEVVGDTLIIGERHQRRFVFGFRRDESRIDYELRVPPQVALQLQTMNGRITTRGVSGEMMVTAVNGEVDIETSGVNEVSAKTVNGRVAARFLSDFHGAKLTTVNGRVIATLPSSASFLGDFTQVNGDFEAAFPLNIHSHPGSRRVSGEVNGGRYALKITTVNGDIKVDNGPNAPSVPAAPSAPASPAPPADAATPAPRG